MRSPIVFAAVLGLVASTGAAAQGDRAPAEALIVVAAAGSVELTADHAVLVLGVEVRDSVAADAAREMDRRFAAVADTLADLGFPWDSLPSAGFGVRPESRRSYEPQTFEARSSVRVTVRDLDRLPAVITAALAAGANQVTSLDFRSTRAAEARRRALAEAVASARQDAQDLAEAAGVELGQIREIRTGSRPGAYYAAGAPLSEISVQPLGAPITPRSITVRAQVQVTWTIRTPPGG